MPFADGLQHKGHESAVSRRLVLRALGQRQRHVAKETIEADQRREVGRLQIVHGADEQRAKDGVVGRENHAGEDAQLEELSDRVVLRGLGHAEPRFLLRWKGEGARRRKEGG